MWHNDDQFWSQHFLSLYAHAPEVKRIDVSIWFIEEC